MLRLASFLSLPLGLLACGGNAPPVTGNTDLLAVGDSYFDIHDDGDIPFVVATSLGRNVENAAIGGTTMLGGDPESIPNRYVSGDFGWLVATGGGNDIGGCACGTADCTPVLDALLDADGSGAIPDLIGRAIDDGTRVAWLTYMRPRPDAEEFADCGLEWDTLRNRMAALDADLEALIHVDGIEFGTGAQPELYADDGYHTSREGSRVLGEALAERIREAERE